MERTTDDGLPRSASYQCASVVEYCFPLFVVFGSFVVNPVLSQDSYGEPVMSMASSWAKPIRRSS